MARPLILSDQALVGGLRRDAAGDERYQSFRSLENFDIVYSPTVSLRRRDRFAAYLADWKLTSSITKLFATTLKTDDLAEVEVLYVVLADGKIFRYNITAPVVTISGVADTGGYLTFTAVTIPNSTTDTLPLSVGDYILVSGSEIEMLDSNNEVIVGSIDTFDGFHKLTTVGIQSVITATAFPTTGTATGTFGTFYRIATLVHDMAVNTGSLSQVDVDVNFQQVGDSVFFSTYTDTGGVEKGWYVHNLNTSKARPVNPQEFPKINVSREVNNTLRHPDMALDYTNHNTTNYNTFRQYWTTTQPADLYVTAVPFHLTTSHLSQKVSVSANNVVVFDAIYLPITIGMNSREYMSLARTQAGNLKVYLLGDNSGPDWSNILAESAWFNPKGQVGTGSSGQTAAQAARENRAPLRGWIDSSTEQGWEHIYNWTFKQTKFGNGALWVDSDFWIVVESDELARKAWSNAGSSEPDPNENLDDSSTTLTKGDVGFWWWTNSVDDQTVYDNPTIPAGIPYITSASGNCQKNDGSLVAEPTTWVDVMSQMFDTAGSNPITMTEPQAAGFIVGQAANLTTTQFDVGGYVAATDSLYDNLRYTGSLVKTDITPESEGQLDLLNNAQYDETRIEVDQPSTFKYYDSLNPEGDLSENLTVSDSLGYPWATHYRIYRQVSSADPSWMWLCDLPISKIGDNIHLPVSKFYQGLSDPQIYLLEDEYEKPVRPSDTEVWNERIWLIDGRKLRYSARAANNSRLAVIGDPIYHSFPLSNVLEFSEFITGLSIFSDRLVVFFKNNIKVIAGASSVLNPPPDLVLADIVKSEGTERTDAIVVMKGGIVFVNQFGQVKLFNGSENTIDLSEPIQSLWETFGNNTTMFSTYYNEQLMIAVDTSGDNIIDKVYILDMGRSRASWRIYDYSTNKLTAIVRTPNNQLLGSISTGTDYRIVVLGGRGSETYLETSVTAEAETHPVPSPNMSTWTKFILQGNYPSTPPSFAVTATAKDGKTSSKTVTPLNDDDVRGHSGGLRIRSNECRLKIVTSGSNLDEVRSIALE